MFSDHLIGESLVIVLSQFITLLWALSYSTFDSYTKKVQNKQLISHAWFDWDLCNYVFVVAVSKQNAP